MTAQADHQTQEDAQTEAEMVRAALLEAGVPEHQFTLSVASPGECQLTGCDNWHAVLNWDLDADQTLIWKAFQLMTMARGAKPVCFVCWCDWTADEGDGCQATSLEQDCGRDR